MTDYPSQISFICIMVSDLWKNDLYFGPAGVNNNIQQQK